MFRPPLYRTLRTSSSLKPRLSNRVPVDEFVERFAAAEPGGFLIFRWIAKDHPVATSRALGEPEHHRGIIRAMECDRTGSDAEGIGGQHEVLGEPADVELVPVRFLDQCHRQGSAADRVREIAAFRDSTLDLGTRDHNDRPGLLILARAGPAPGLEDRVKVGIGKRPVLELPDDAQLQDIPVGLGITRRPGHQSSTTAAISRSLARLWWASI